MLGFQHMNGGGDTNMKTLANEIEQHFLDSLYNSVLRTLVESFTIY